MNAIGKYKILGLLGRGGMSKVYKVEVPLIGKILGLKRLDPDPMLVSLMGMEKIRRLFVREAATMARLRHPNILEIIDYNEDTDHPYYLMPYYCNNLGVMIGETYQTEKPSRVIRLDNAIVYTRQILAGLARMHHSGIIHRDIKPFNLLISDRDTIKICDFGLSKLRGEAFDGPPNLKVGSPWYAAPEQEENPDAIDARADLFPVGVMLHRMLTGLLPQENATKPSRLNPDLDPSWDAFIARAAAALPSHRFHTAAEMAGELEKLSLDWEKKKGETCRLPPPQAPASAKPRRARLRSRSIKVPPGQAQKAFDLDHLFRPRAYVENDFVIKDPGTVFDGATGLTWQRSGSPYPMTWQDAKSFIDQLNQEKRGGRSDWRLPTIAELISLLSRPQRYRDFCLESPFDQTQKWFWSCDRRSFCAAWFVSFDLGFVAWQDFTGIYHVKGVHGEA